MELIAFQNDRNLANEFIRCGLKLNKDKGNFITPFADETKAKLSSLSTMYNGQGNDLRHFLVRKNGSTVARATAFVNRQMRDRDGIPVGTIGMFECVNDFAIARRLLDAAVEWLAIRHGLRRVWGPMDFDIWHGYRFMTRGFDRQPFLGEPRNRRYYPAFFERYGFTVKAEWDSLEVTGHSQLRQMIARGEKRFQLLRDRGYRFEHPQRSSLTGEDDRLHKAMLQSFSGFLGFTPISKTEINALLRRSLPAFDPRLAVLVYNDVNQLAGFAIAYREIGPAISAMNGHSNPWSRLKFLYHRRRSSTANFYIGGVTPQELSRRSGLGRAGFYFIINNAIALGYSTVLLTLRLKGNHAHGLAARSNLQPQREYALYEWNYG